MRTRRVALALSALVSAGLLACVLLADEPEPGRRYALVVGVQDYRGTDLGSLRYCDNDAAGLAEVLGQRGYRVTLMTQPAWKAGDREDLLPTAENIRDNLKAVLRNRRPADTVLLAFSGHGEQLKRDGKMYFCAAKCNLDKPETLIALDEVYALLKDNPAGGKVLIVDACRNDPLAGRTVGSEKLESVTRPELPDPPGGTVALFSCSKGEKAYESNTLKHGYLFHFVIEGLQGKAAGKGGRIKWTDLTKHVDDELSDAVVQELGAKAVQTPEVRGESHGLVLAQLDAGSGLPDATVTESGEKGEAFEYTVEGNIKKGARQVRTLDLGGGVTLELVHIKAGTFMMGSPDSDKDAGDDEKPQHEVTITKDFYLGKYLVTKKQFARFVAAKDGYETEAEKDKEGGWGLNAASGKFEGRKPEYTWKNTGFEQSDNDPVVNVTWNDAAAFCEWASQATTREVTLPTEAQWEYACRGGTTTRYFTGDAVETLEKSANIADASFQAKSPAASWPVAWEDGYAFTSPVAKFQPNPFGLYDMAGNVWEWCSDNYDPKCYGNSDKNDPENTTETDARVLRGGSFDSEPRHCRAACRNGLAPANRYCSSGFRVRVRLD